MTAKHTVQSGGVIFKGAWKWHRLTLGMWTTVTTRRFDLTDVVGIVGSYLLSQITKSTRVRSPKARTLTTLGE